MPVVSVDAPSLKLGYGVHAEKTFWCKQGVLRVKELRDSHDEQIVADLAVSILMDEPFGVSRERLDEAYDTQTRLHADLNNRLAAYPSDKLRRELKRTFSALTETVKTVDSSPNAFRKIVNPKARGNPVRTPFYAVFMAFFHLIIREDKQPVDSTGILGALDDLADKLETASHHVKPTDRRKNIDSTVGLIQKHFVHKELPSLPHGRELVLDFENSLRRSKIETPRYEFKQGLYDLSADPRKNPDLVQRIAEVACSIANLTPGTDGYIYIVVADKEADATRIAQLDNVSPINRARSV